MKESERISKLFADQWSGEPWLGVSWEKTLREITAKEASSRPFPGFNSIWEIVIHLLGMRQAVLRRLEGEPIETPDDNYFHAITDRSEAAWQQLITQMEQTTRRLQELLLREKSAALSRQSVQPPFTRYELLMGLLQHDAYHLGQIRLLHRLARFRM
ncbi:MAG: DinB family protein [Chitinophagales bacterium]|nr:DinB family protein [Chitinophagales bacterium]MDW8428138.1 DinB family protein [Chitinophagales bacterium]